jgi:Domain of unknown function(DUF2779).
MKPFQFIVFQLSCHILHEDGRLEHFAYLHTDMSDPREIVIERLINIIRTDDDEARGKMIKDLREYCTLDTLAMVEIHKFLQNMI